MKYPGRIDIYIHSSVESTEPRSAAGQLPSGGLRKVTAVLP
ncbi:hypothetical protein P3T40_002263 [Paraburkholderia sp. EB58]|jgi:hypothetical protein